jgi:hypothetical protein
MTRLLYIAGLLSLVSGCSLLFDDEAASLDAAPPGIDASLAELLDPIIRYDFEGMSDQPIVSSGSETLELTLLDGATRSGGALRLVQDDNDFDHALSVGNADNVREACVAEKGLTMAAWVTTRGTSPLESTPARIVSIENLGISRTSMTLGQFDSLTQYNAFVARVGPTQQIESAPLDYEAGTPVWVFFTVDIDGRYRFQVGDRDPEQDTVGTISDLWDWEPGSLLSVGGSDNGRRPFEGEIHHVEVFCRDLDGNEREALKNATDPRERAP